MEIDLAQKAIDFALQGKWREALEVNLQILKDNPTDIDSLNRLARVHAELGDITKARATAEKVLKIDPLNSIALKCIDKWKQITKVRRDTSFTPDVDAFLEEPGKTKMVTLLNTGDEKIFANLNPGEEVKIVPFAHRVSAMTQDGRYVGRLPDDLALRLKGLMKAGYKYQVLVKSVGHREVDVFIREIEKGSEARDVQSFPPEKIDYVAFTPPELVHQDQPLGADEDDLGESEEII